MTATVVLSINGSLLRVECDGLARDQLLAKNVVLTGCKELDTEGRDGLPVDTKIWSVPESLVISYAVGQTRAETEPAAAAPVEVAPAIEVVQELTDEQKEARRKRYAASDALLSGKKPPVAKKPAATKPAAPKK